MWKYLLLLTTLLLFACGEEKSFNKDFDRTSSTQKIIVLVYDTRAEMQRAQAKFKKEATNSDLLGWAKWSNIESSGCEIHVVKLKHSDDTKEMSTWGHELTHCMYGSFHK